MKKGLFVLMAVPLLLLGCSDEPKVDTNEGPIDESSILVNVDILTPEEVPVGEAITLSAKVTQGDEAVDDADAVKFEVWESGYRDEGQMITGDLEGNGVYSAEITFDHDGVYYMYAHTDARGLHIMPKQQLIVGDPDMSQVIEDDSDSSMGHLEHHHSEDTHDEHEHHETSEEDSHEPHHEDEAEEVENIE